MFLFLFLKRKVFFQASTELDKNVHLNTDSKLLKQRDTHFGRYRVTVIILSFKVTLWKVRPMLSQYWFSSSGLFLDTRPSCKKQNPFSLQQISQFYQQTVPIETPELESRSGRLSSAQPKPIFQATFLGSSCTKSLLLLQLRFADIISKKRALGIPTRPIQNFPGQNHQRRANKVLSNQWMCLIRGYWDWQKRKAWLVKPRSLTSAVEGTAAERGWHGWGRLLRFGLHNNLIALHETLTNKLLKHLLGCHLHSFLIPPGHKG